MPTAELSQLSADEVVAACRENAAEIGGAIGRALDAQITATVGECSVYTAQTPPAELAEAGLAIVLTAGPSAAIVGIPQASGLVPPWCAAPDATGVSRLATLAQELGMLVVPGTIIAEPFKTACVRSLAGAIRRGGLAEPAHLLTLNLVAADGRQGNAFLVWPASNAAAVFGAGGARPPKAKPPAPPRPRAASPGRPMAAQPKPRVAGVQDLPVFSKSLLKIRLPLVVTLARKRQPVGRIVEIGPGLIIQFEKSCEEMLDLEVGGHRVACGEAVKVGDKFGLRITSMILPDERFKSFKPASK
jgi:flagellar motor switch/type III secretory pathway protein FliN